MRMPCSNTALLEQYLSETDGDAELATCYVCGYEDFADELRQNVSGEYICRICVCKCETQRCLNPCVKGTDNCAEHQEDRDD